MKPVTIAFGTLGALTILSVGSCVANKVGYIGNQANRVFEKTFDADNMVGNYEWFKQQYQDIKAYDVKITASQLSFDTFLNSAGDRKTWTFEDKQEYNRQNTVINALKIQRASMVAEYNARASMANRNIFRTNDLPESL